MGNVSGRPISGNAVLSQTEYDRASRRFCRLSGNRDRITIRQLTSLPQFANNPFVGRIFELYDGDADGVLKQEEFLLALQRLRLLASDPAERLKIAFELFDLDMDRHVSVLDMATVLQCTTSQSGSRDHLKAVAAAAIAKHDTEGDGRLTPQQFRKMVQSSFTAPQAMSC